MGYDLDLKIGDKLSLVFSLLKKHLSDHYQNKKLLKLAPFYNSGFNDFDKNIAL